MGEKEPLLLDRATCISLGIKKKDYLTRYALSRCRIVCWRRRQDQEFFYPAATIGSDLADRFAVDPVLFLSLIFFKKKKAYTGIIYDMG